jgi:hypothetical protein
MSTSPNITRTLQQESVRQSQSEGSSDKDQTRLPPSSEEESEVFIGPATTRLLETENPPDYIERAREVIRRSTICRYYISPSGCQREGCTWKHENPEDHDPDINARMASTTVSLKKRGKYNTIYSTSYVNVKMKELQIKNNELTRKNKELESENRKLRCLTEDVEFLRKENSRLRRLLRGNVWHGESTHATIYPSRRPLSHYNVPSPKYGQPPTSWRASRESLLRPLNEYGSRFLDRNPRGAMSDPDY